MVKYKIIDFTADEIFSKINFWTQKGIYITYDLIDQIENGYADDVAEGILKEHTFTIRVEDSKNGYKIIYEMGAVNTIEEAYKGVLSFLEHKFKKELKKGF